MNGRYRIRRLKPPLRRPGTLAALRLHERVLGRRLTLQGLREWVQGRRPLLLVAVDVREHRLVGYKFGFEDRPGRFYSWIGGVHPEHRGQGLGRALMERQHALVARAGFRTVRTITFNRHRAMLLLNLTSGFDIIGTLWSRGELRIVLEKALKASAGEASGGPARPR